MTKNIALLITIITLICSCRAKETQTEEQHVHNTSDHPIYIDRIEQGHQKALLVKNDVVCFNLEVTFGERKSKYKIFTTPTSSKIKMEKLDGTVTIMKNGTVYTNADSTKWESEQFGLFTYQYFFMAPYKLSDPGTRWKKLPMVQLEESAMNTAMLTFEDGTGDAPDDWYVVHSDPQTNRITYMGYIVTGGTIAASEAEKNAHAIKYLDYRTIDGIPISHKWQFFDYSRTNGLGELIGEGSIKNAMFMEDIDHIFDTNGLQKIN